MSDIELMPRARPMIAIPIGSPIAMTDPNARSRMTTAATRPIISPRPVSASSNAKNRSPPISICNGEPALAWMPSSWRFSRSPTLSSSSTGYWTRMRGDSTVRRYRSARGRLGSSGHRSRCIGGVEHVGQVGDRRLDPDQGGLRVSRVEECRLVVERCQDHLGSESGLVGLGDPEQVDGVLGVQTRNLEGVLEFLTEGAGCSDHEHREDNPCCDHGPGATGREPAPAVQS